MNRRHFLAAGAAASVAACADVPRVMFNYRLKVVLDDNGQERSGASVIKVEWRNSSKIPMSYSGGYKSKVWGEAPIVDLGAHGLLFALLWDNAFDEPVRFSAALTPVARLCSDKETWNPRSQFSNFKPDFWTAAETVHQKTGEHDLWPSQLPLLVRFEDITMPASITEVHPERVAEIFGTRISLRRASIEITDETPTERILKTLPWLSEAEFLAKPPMDMRTASFAERTRSSHFRTWG